jgi:hypothetical protein
MELEVNERGNLFVPAPRLAPMVWVIALSVAAFYLLGWLKSEAMPGIFASPPIVLGVLLMCAVAAHWLLGMQTGLEFDNSRKQVMKGRKVITPYHQIRQVELCRAEGDDAGYTIRLRLGPSRSYPVLATMDETSASLDAAEIARAVGKEVQLLY